jgi:hypothetical protein
LLKFATKRKRRENNRRNREYYGIPLGAGEIAKHHIKHTLVGGKLEGDYNSDLTFGR